MSENKQTITIGRFIGIIFRTDIPYAKRWLKDHIGAIVGFRGKKGLQRYCHNPLTPESASELVLGVTARITHDIHGNSGTLAMAEAGKRFFEQIIERAKPFDAEVSEDARLALVLPKKFLSDLAKSA